MELQGDHHQLLHLFQDRSLKSQRGGRQPVVAEFTFVDVVIKEDLF